MSDLAVEGGEPVEEPVAAPEGEATEVEAPVEAQAPAAEAPALDPLELQAELEHVRSQNNELYGLLQQIATQSPDGQFAQQAQQQTGLDVNSLTDEYGNLDPAKFAAYQTQRDQSLIAQIGQMFQPLQQTFAQQQEQAVIAEGEQRLQDIIQSDIAQNGEFASNPEADAQARDLVTTLASQMFPDVAQRYGSTPQAAEIAMTRAAAQVRSLLRSVGGAAVEQTQNQLATLAGAKGEPGAHGAGVEAPVIRIGETSAARFAAGSN